LVLDLADAGLPAQVAPPRFDLSTRLPHLLEGCQVLAYSVVPGAPGEDPRLGIGAAELLYGLGLDPGSLMRTQRVSGEVGEVFSIPLLGPASEARVAAHRLLLVGVGDESSRDLRRAGAALARACRDQAAVATTIAAGSSAECVEAFVEGAVLGSFGFHWRSTGPPWRPVERVVLAGDAGTTNRGRALARGVALGRAGWTARVLASVPANLKSPSWFAARAQAEALASGLTCEIWDERDLAAHGFGGVLAVGRAAASPPRLLRLDYTPPKSSRRTPRVVLVGKGITFDTGGLSIKNGEAMRAMKRDMTGGGIVVAVMAALAALGCRLKVTGLVPAAENAVSGEALRPGDVVRHYGGRTTEVTNTDGEGRLVLADALAYAVDTLSPAAVVDVATLTGAVRIALGQRTGGLFATDDALASRLVAAGEAAGEPLWRLPLVTDYEEKLSSKVADADNSPGGPGAIMAALFLRRFVGEVPWAHLDLAGAGDAPEDSFEWTQGPTGFGARAVLRWLASDSPLEGVR
jgi:leucyl aminopeptidase